MTLVDNRLKMFFEVVNVHDALPKKDIAKLSTTEVINVFHATFSNYILESNLKYYDCLGKALRDFLNALTSFVVEFVTINNKIDNYISNQLLPTPIRNGDTDEKLRFDLELDNYSPGFR